MSDITVPWSTIVTVYDPALYRPIGVAAVFNFERLHRTVHHVGIEKQDVIEKVGIFF